jgi:hypothetical protein
MLKLMRNPYSSEGMFATKANVNPKRQSHKLLKTVREIIIENPSGIKLQEIYRQIEQRYPLTERQKARDPNTVM